MPEKKRISPAVVIIPIGLGLAAVAGAVALTLAGQPKVYTCPHCGAEFASEEELLAHIQAEHPGQPSYICPYCGQAFWTETELQEHIQLAHPVPQYICPHCGQAFWTETELQEHIELQHPEEPPPDGVAEFAYASGIRGEYSDAGLWLLFEVDIKNVGTGAGACTITAYAQHAYGVPTVKYFVRTATIEPGQTITFSGAVENDDPTGSDPDYWLRLVNISSEAGIITPQFGTATGLVSVYVPARIKSGSEFWATQVLRLPYGADQIFRPVIRLRNVTNRKIGCEASAADIATVNYSWRQFNLETGTQEYEIKGLWDNLYGAGPGGARQRPAKAEYWREPDLIPLPAGTYNILSTLRYGQVVDPDTYAGLWDVWRDVVVGQVEIYE